VAVKERHVRIAPLVYWLARTSPSAFCLVRPLWQRLKRVLRLNPTTERRRRLRYYEETVRLARVHAAAGGSVLDVGAHDSDVLQRLVWFDRRVGLDLEHVPPQRGVEIVLGDFLDYRPEELFDLVVCLEVLEHLDDPSRFAAKLLATGRTVIVSVPYRWPAGTWPTHKQDPVDEAKLESWMGRPPVESRIVSDGRERLIAVFRGVPKGWGSG
jgi:SAM-dependent methyltransferase